jgi:glycosyltransferase involved in cell wall biosynthesis
LNKALKYSKGEIIVRHDCDDISLPNRLEVIYNFFLNNKHIDIVSSYVFVKENSTKKKYIIPLKDKEIKNKLIFTNIIVHPSVAFRKNKIDEIGGYNEYFLYAQDYELYLRAIHNNLIFETIPKFLVEKSISENNITVKKRKQQLLYELAAKCLYFAKEFNYIKSVYSLSLTLYKFFIPNFLRKLRGKI